MALREKDIRTGLYTPGFLVAFGAREFAFARENGYPLSLLTVNIGGIDEDGDPEIVYEDFRKLAERLREEAGEGSIVGQLSDDEIVVLLPGTPPEKARRIADKITRAMESIERFSSMVSSGRIFIRLSSTDDGHSEFKDLLYAGQQQDINTNTVL